MKKKREPMRRCAGCMNVKLKKELIRILCDSEGRLKIDDSGREAGRGVYVCPDEMCILSLKKKRGISRSLRREISGEVLEDIFERLLTHVKQS